MPRSSSSSHRLNKSSVVPYKHKQPVSIASPSTGQTLKDSLVSGVGSGIGFGMGSRIVSGLFGAPVIAVETEAKNTVTRQTTVALQQCQQNTVDVDVGEKPLCYALLSNDPKHTEFKQCMQASENQIHMCKEFLSN